MSISPLPSPKPYRRHFFAALAAACLAAPSPAADAQAPARSDPGDAWPASVQQHIAMVAVELMPASLQGQLRRHAGELRAGALAPLGFDEPAEFHALHADGRYGRADERVAQQLTKVVTLLDQRQPFSEVVFELGVLSHYVADVAWPLSTSDADPREERYLDDYARYAERNLPKFPLAFDGYYPFHERAFELRDYLRSVSERANMSYALLGRYYFPSGSDRMVTSRSFDDRHPAFGIAQLSYNHAVSAVANVWLFAWREARGDTRGLARNVAPVGSEAATGEAAGSAR